MAQSAGGQCVTALTSEESFAAAYLDRLLNDAERAGMELVTWIFGRDGPGSRDAGSASASMVVPWRGSRRKGSTTR